MSSLFGTLAVSTILAATLNSGVNAPTPPPLFVPANASTVSGSDSDSVDDILDSANTHTTDHSGGSSVKAKDESGNSSSDSDSAPTGIDISSHQHNGSSAIDIPQAVSGGQQFAFIKATESNNYINPNFRKDVISFIKKDTPVGFYHYAKPGVGTAKEQAQYFVTVTGINKGVKSFPPVLDIEESGGLSSDDLITWVDDFVSEVKKLTGRDVMIYTYTNFWQNEMGDTKKFSDLPLWIANYSTSLKKSAIPGGWTNWTFWQYTAKGHIDGYDNDIDVNVYNGSQEDLRKLYTASDSSSLPFASTVKDTGSTSAEKVTSTVTVDPPKLTVTSTVTVTPSAVQPVSPVTAAPQETMIPFTEMFK